MAKTTDDRLDELINLMRNQASRSSSSSSDKKTSVDLSLDKAGLVKQIGEYVIPGAAALKKSIYESQDMYQSLSKAGMNFSGDLFAMSNAAVGMRMSTKEMEESFLNFQKDGILKGFGTNLTNSAEGFAKASKSFFDNNTETTDSLRRMGFTTKDINEVLALQGVTLRGKFKDDQEMAAVAAANAEKLAYEMDGLSKLTGKSRAEQAEMMKKQQADMQFEAAIRLKTQGMSAEKAAEFEANARRQLHEAQVLGQGQMFKEIFATGQIITKEAATQAALNREQAAAAQKMAQVAADKTLDANQRLEKGNEARNQLMAAATKDLNDTTKLQAATLGDVGGTFSKVTMENMGKQIEFSRVLEKVAAERGLSLKDEKQAAEAAKFAMEEIRKSQEGMKKTGKDQYEQVDASSRALAKFEGRLGDVQSVLNEKFVQPIQKEVNVALRDFTNAVLGAKGTLGGTLNEQKPGGQPQTVAQRFKSEIEAGEAAGVKDAKGVVQTIAAGNKEVISAVSNTINNSDWRNSVADGFMQKFRSLTEKRSSGSLGMSGKLIEDFGPGRLVELHGMEGVVTPKDLNDIVKNTMEGTLKSVPKTGVMDYEQMAKVAELQKQLTETGQGNLFKEGFAMRGSSKTDNIDLKSMSNNIKTDISSSFNMDKIDRKSLKFDQFGMPITSDIKFKSAEIAQEVQKKEEKKAAARPDVEAAKKDIAAGTPLTEEKKSEATKPAVASKETSLNDVVVALNQVNTKLNTLIDVQRDIGQKQIKATKANSSDVYAR